MTWLIIFLVLAVAIGPVLYFLPNARDKRLTALREQARKLGLTVQITSIPKLDPAAHERVSAGAKTLRPRRVCTAYKVSVGQNLADVEALLLLKLPENPTVLVNEVVPGWALDDDSSESFWRSYAATDEAKGQLSAALASLPEDALAVAVDKRFVSCYWLEKSSPESTVVSELRKVLDALRADLCRRFQVTSAS